MLGTVLLILLVLLLVGALPHWGYASSWNMGYAPSGGIGLILLVVILLVVFGRL